MRVDVVYLGFSRPLRASLCELRPDKSLEPAEVTEIHFFSFPLTPLLAGQGVGKKKSINPGAGFDSQYLARHSGFHLPVPPRQMKNDNYLPLCPL